METSLPDIKHPDLASLVKHWTRSVATRLGVVSALLVIGMTFGGVVGATVWRSNSALTASGKWLVQAVLMGDLAQVKRQFSSFVSSEVFDGAWLLSAVDGKVVASESRLEGYEPDLHPHSGFDLRLTRAGLLVESSRLLGDTNNLAGCIIVATIVPITWFLIPSAVLLLLIAMFLLQLSRYLKRLTVIIGDPLVDFAGRLQQIGRSELTAELNFATVATGYAEIETVVRSFSALWQQTLATEAIRKQLAEQTAIARMTQMLAHDVRKPFSILRMGLGMLGNAKDPAGVKKVLTRLIPEIDKAVGSVDGLIADVMEVGSVATQLIREPANPVSLIEASLQEACRIYPGVQITINYDLRHIHMVNAHVQKVGRVFSNIVGNALQAMNYKGGLWFKTAERGGFIEFCVGNRGSVIPSESLGKLFDAFFTSGKKGGTGLGLAIAQKVVTAHGGRIWCESGTTSEHPDGKVEFFFTLPIADGRVADSVAQLPIHSDDITKGMGQMAVESGSMAGSSDKDEEALEVDIVKAAVKLGRPLRVLAVDDEALYREALATYLARTVDLECAIKVVKAAGAREALAASTDHAFDLVISDVDMGTDSLDGFDLVRQLKASDLVGLVCIHSNRIVAADHKRALEAGADMFLPKPMARAQLLRLVLQAFQASAALVNQTAERQGAVSSGAIARPEILIVDDNPFILDAWEDMLREEADVHLISSYESLSERLDSDPGFAGRLVLAVTDMNIDGSQGDGLDVGRLLKKHSPYLPVLLSSDGSLPAGLLTGAIDRVIGKDPVGLSTLQS